MIQCKLEKLGTKEYGNIFGHFLILGEERAPAKNARGCKIEG